MAQLPRFDRLTKAAGAESWEWLQDNAATWAEGVSESVESGATPEQVYRHVLREVGQHREPLAKRCQLAARHLIAERAT